MNFWLCFFCKKLSPCGSPKPTDKCRHCGATHRQSQKEENKSLPVGFEAKTDDDCKRMAIAFAESVS